MWPFPLMNHGTISEEFLWKKISKCERVANRNRISNLHKSQPKKKTKCDQIRFCTEDHKENLLNKLYNFNYTRRCCCWKMKCDGNSRCIFFKWKEKQTQRRKYIWRKLILQQKRRTKMTIILIDFLHGSSWRSVCKKRRHKNKTMEQITVSLFAINSSAKISFSNDTFFLLESYSSLRIHANVIILFSSKN